MVDALSHRLTYQEWFNRDVVEALTTHGLAAGAACQVDAEQLCLLLGEDRRGDERGLRGLQSLPGRQLQLLRRRKLLKRRRQRS